MNIPRLQKKFEHSPVLRLTFGYTAIIMLISVMFSSIIYALTVNHFRASFPPPQRFLQVFSGRFQQYDQDVADLFEERYQQVVVRLRISLIVLNALVLAGASVTSYFLAKRTLRPIEHALDEQRRFTADASHELRTPLAAMQAEIDVALRDRQITDLKPILQSNLEEIAKLEKLSSSLLQLARHEGDQTGVARKPVQLSTIAQDACGRIAKIAQIKQITVECRGLDHAVMGDAARLTDLLVILLDNAVKYSPEKSTVRLEGIIHKNESILRVVDQGAGIAPEDLPHVFKRFYRADASRSKHKANGFGLGLSIAKQIVDQHHGTIRLESEVGKGTTVTITLPLVSV